MEKLTPPGATTTPPAPPETSAPAPGPTRPDVIPRWPRLAALLAAIWMAIIVALWLGLHSPFNIEFPAYDPSVTARIPGALANLLSGLALLAACILASGLTGWLVLAGVWRQGAERLTPLEQALFGLGLGLGLNIMLVLGLGLAGGVNRGVAFGLLALELAGGLALARRRGSGLPFKPVRNWWSEAGRAEKLVAGWLALAAALTLLMSFAPPVAWDALMYHLEGPRQYLQAGRIEHLPRLGQASFPFGAEMLFLWGMLLHGDGLAQAFSWLYGMTGALACYALAQRYFTRLPSPRERRLAGLIAAALYLSVPHVWLLATWAYTDLMIAFYALLALYALLLAVDQAGTGRVAGGYAALGGLMAGLSFGGKYTAVLAGIGAAAGAAVYAGLDKARPRPGWGRLAAGLLIYGLTGTLAFAPWLLRNIVFSGNPFAPLFGGIQGWEKEEIIALAGQDGGLALTPEVVLGRPLGMVLLGRGGGLFDATISPLFLALLPLGVWAAGRTRALAGLWLATGVTYLGWLAGIRLSAAADHTRLIASTLPLLALITACALVDGSATARRGPARLPAAMARLLTGLFLAVSGFMLLLFFIANNPLSYHFGLQNRAEWVESELGSYARVAAFAGTLPPSTRLYLFVEPRAYYFPVPTSPDHNSGGQFFLYTTRYPTPATFQAELTRRGATHALVNEKLLEFLVTTPEYKQTDKARAARRLLDDLLSQGYLERVYQEKGEYTIYRLTSPAPA